MEKLDNYFLNVNWIDLKRNTHPVGYFVLYNEKFYFKICGKDSATRAYDEGFDGRPGIKADKIYSSSEVFDTINKILGLKQTEKEKIEIMKEILANKIEGDSAIDNRRDRMSFDEMVERDIKACKDEIDEFEKLNQEQEDTSR